MSFKREGDDQSQLNILKKRRVADLLSNFIPEDEATLIKNGRYTCLVCSYRPVFDTVDMLVVHRKGKRHLEGLKWFYGNKTELKNEIVKRQHENYVQAEDTRQPSSSAPLLAKTRELTHHALLKTVPYNSCHRKTSTKSEKGPVNSNSDTSISTTRATPLEQHGTFCKSEDTKKSLLSSPCSSTAESWSSRKKQGSHVAATQQSEPLQAQRRQELEHYLKLKSDGWIKDRSGQWVKDENVEFDSDEEEPPALTPPPPSE